MRLIDIPERQVAYIRVTNAFEEHRVLAALKTMIEWAKSQNIFSQGILFGKTVDDPHVTPKHLYRYEVCLASSLLVECTEGMSKLKMPAMRYAVTKVSGDIRKVATAWDHIYRNWLINSAGGGAACRRTGAPAQDSIPIAEESSALLNTTV